MDYYYEQSILIQQKKTNMLVFNLQLDESL